MIDIMDIKKAVKDKQIVFFVNDGKIFCRWHEDNGEIVCVGKEQKGVIFMWDDYIDLESLDLEDLKALKNDLLDLLAEINERINEEEEYDEESEVEK